MERHSKVCKKINNNTRKAFDSKKQRHVVDEFGGFTKKKSDTRFIEKLITKTMYLIKII